VSITFDPYLSISLPIPKAPNPHDFHQIDFYLVFSNPRKQSLSVKQETYNVETDTIGDILSNLSDKFDFIPEHCLTLIQNQ